MMKDMQREKLIIRKKQTVRSERSLKRTKKHIRQVLECNLQVGSWFLTFTFRDDIRDYDDANKIFKKYIRQYGDIRYMKIVELQNENRNGVIHYHLIIFDKVDYIEWPHGWEKQKKIKDLNYARISNYFSGYLTDIGKNQLIETNKNIFSVSKNCYKPIELESYVYDYILNNNMDVDIKRMNIDDYETIKKEITCESLARCWFENKIIKVV